MGQALIAILISYPVEPYEEGDSEHSFICAPISARLRSIINTTITSVCLGTLKPRTRDVANAVTTTRRLKACEGGDCVSEVSRMERLCSTLHGGSAIPS